MGVAEVFAAAWQANAVVSASEFELVAVLALNSAAVVMSAGPLPRRKIFAAQWAELPPQCKRYAKHCDRERQSKRHTLAKNAASRTKGEHAACLSGNEFAGSGDRAAALCGNPKELRGGVDMSERGRGNEESARRSDLGTPEGASQRRLQGRARPHTLTGHLAALPMARRQLYPAARPWTGGSNQSRARQRREPTSRALFPLFPSERFLRSGLFAMFQLEDGKLQRHGWIPRGVVDVRSELADEGTAPRSPPHRSCGASGADKSRGDGAWPPVVVDRQSCCGSGLQGAEHAEGNDVGGEHYHCCGTLAAPSACLWGWLSWEATASRGRCVQQDIAPPSLSRRQEADGSHGQQPLEWTIVRRRRVRRCALLYEPRHDSEWTCR